MKSLLRPLADFLFSYLVEPRVVHHVPPDHIIGGDYLYRWYVARVPGEEDQVGHVYDPAAGTEEKRYVNRETGQPVNGWMNKWFNLYVHLFGRSDEDRALHDHPAWNISFILRGYAVELLQDGTMRLLGPGSITLRRSGTIAHRIILIEGKPVWSLFFMWRKQREWGFHCPERGWVHWKIFTGYNETGDSRNVGRGCE